MKKVKTPAEILSMKLKPVKPRRIVITEKPKPKTYQFKGKTVIAVPQVDFSCSGCAFEHDGKPCFRDEMARLKVPNCLDKGIIFKLSTDEI